MRAWAPCGRLPFCCTARFSGRSAAGHRFSAIDKHTGQRVFQCRVVDMDPELEGRSRETVAKILADRMPTRRPGAA
jgi:hypothetical protein